MAVFLQIFFTSSLLRLKIMHLSSAPLFSCPFPSSHLILSFPLLPICFRYASDMLPICLQYASDICSRKHIGSMSDAYCKHIGSTWEHIGTILGAGARIGLFKKWGYGGQNIGVWGAKYGSLLGDIFVISIFFCTFVGSKCSFFCFSASNIYIEQQNTLWKRYCVWRG